MRGREEGRRNHGQMCCGKITLGAIGGDGSGKIEPEATNKYFSLAVCGNIFVHLWRVIRK